MLVDAAPRGGEPGTLYVIEPPRDAPPDGAAGDRGTRPGPGQGAAPGRGPGRAGRAPAAGRLRAGAGREADDMRMGMSEPVRAAVEQAVPLVESLVGRLLRGEAIEAV